MTEKSLGLWGLVVAVLGLIAAVYFRPRIPRISYDVAKTRVIPGIIAGVKVDLDNVTTTELFLVQVSLTSRGASIGRDDIVKPLSVRFHPSYGRVKLANSISPEHVVLNISTGINSAWGLSIDNFNRNDVINLYFLTSKSGVGVVVNGALRGLSGNPVRERLTQGAVNVFTLILSMFANWYLTAAMLIGAILAEELWLKVTDGFAAAILFLVSARATLAWRANYRRLQAVMSNYRDLKTTFSPANEF